MTTSTAPTASLRDLDEDAFRERYDTDRLTATVLASRCRYVVHHMTTGLATQAFSPIIRDWYDFAATVSAPPEQDYAMAVASQSLAVFAGIMGDGLRNAVIEFGVEDLRPGDVLMCNDPQRIGTHVNDTLFVKPVFHDGQLTCFASIQAHQLDMGGIVPFGFSGTKKNVYENGLVIPPMLLYREGTPVKSAFSIFLDNVRMGGVILADLMTINQSLTLAERLLTETLDRYGRDALLGALRFAVDGSAETMVDALERIPDGIYEGQDTIDADGESDVEEYTVKVRVNKRGGRCEVDLSGTSRQALGSINGGFLDAKTMIGLALRLLIDRRSHYNSGSFDPVDLVIPPGTMVSAMPPDAAIFLYWETTAPLITTMFRALRDALGEEAVGGDFGSLCLHNANGLTTDGTPWASQAVAGGEHGPWGASRHGDGDGYNVPYYANSFDPPTEASETDAPMVILRKEYVPDTAGAGTNRGGCSVRRDTLWRTDAEHYVMPLHLRHTSGVGVHGGEEGALGGVWLLDREAFDIEAEQDLAPVGGGILKKATTVAGVFDTETHELDPEGEYSYFARNPVWKTEPNAMFRYITNGGGGWGNPLERDPERVADDVRDEYVTIEGALAQYGVVVTGDPHGDPEGVAVDAEATQKERAQRAG